MCKRNILIIVFVIIGGELFGRLFGLGFPLLFKESDNYEYSLKENQVINRFFNNITTNEYGMRASPNAGDRYDYLIIGDSVVNGGASIDDNELASSLLSDFLIEHKQRKVIVGNVSAASWGVENQYKFIVEYKLKAKVRSYLVLNSEDRYDVPDFDSFAKKKIRDENYYLAYHEIISKLGGYFFSNKEKVAVVDVEERETRVVHYINEIIDLLSADSDLVVLFHPKRSEIKDDLVENNKDWLWLKNIVERKGVALCNLGGVYKDNMYLDDIHLNASGQAALFDAIKYYEINSKCH